MSQAAAELVVAAFEREQGAEDALQQLKTEHAHSIYAAGMIRRDKNNVLHIRELADATTETGTGSGALIGGVIGLLFPPGILAPNLFGATIGVLAARLQNKGMSEARLEELGKSLVPGTSAMIAVVDHQSADDVTGLLQMHKVTFVRNAISAEVLGELELQASPMLQASVDSQADGATNSIRMAHSRDDDSKEEGERNPSAQETAPKPMPLPKTAADSSTRHDVPTGKQAGKTGAADGISATP